MNALGDTVSGITASNSSTLPNTISVVREDGTRAFYEIYDKNLFKSLANMRDSGRGVIDWVGRATRAMAALTTEATRFSLCGTLQETFSGA